MLVTIRIDDEGTDNIKVRAEFEPALNEENQGAAAAQAAAIMLIALRREGDMEFTQRTVRGQNHDGTNYILTEEGDTPDELEG